MVQIIIPQISQQIVMQNGMMVIAKEWLEKMFGKPLPLILDFHAKITEEGNPKNYFLEAFGSTYMNGQLVPLGKKQLIEHNCSIMLGSRNGIALIFKDEGQAQRQVDSLAVKTERMDYSKLKSAAEAFSREFCEDCPNSYDGFCKYVVDFFCKKWKITRAIFYKINEKMRKWIHVYGRAAQKEFTPPMSIIREVWRERKPVRFDFNEALDDDKSLSIVTGNVNSAVCFPLLIKEEMIGVLYFDTQNKHVSFSQEDMVVICSLIPTIARMFSVFSAQESELVSIRSFLASYAPSENFDKDKLQVSFNNKSLFSFGMTRNLSVSGMFFAFCSFSFDAEKKKDATKLIAIYSSALSLFDLVAIDNQSDYPIIYEKFIRIILPKFPDIEVSMVIGVMTSSFALHLYGCGNVKVIVKPPEKQSFVTDFVNLPLMMGRKNSHDQGIVSSLADGSDVYISAYESEQIHRIMDLDLASRDKEVAKLQHGLRIRIKDGK